jgi:hypothetical protein
MVKHVYLNAITQYSENPLHFALMGNADPSIIYELVHRGVDVLGKSDKSIGLSSFFQFYCSEFLWIIGGMTPYALAAAPHVKPESFELIHSVLLKRMIRACSVEDKATLELCFAQPNITSNVKLDPAQGTTALHYLCQVGV